MHHNCIKSFTVVSLFVCVLIAIVVMMGNTSIAEVSSTENLSQRVKVLEEYATLLEGTWELEGDKGQPPWEFVFDASCLSINAIGQVYYQWYTGSGSSEAYGEILLTLDADKICIIYVADGRHEITTYRRMK